MKKKINLNWKMFNLYFNQIFFINEENFLSFDIFDDGNWILNFFKDTGYEKEEKWYKGTWAFVLRDLFKIELKFEENGEKVKIIDESKFLIMIDDLRLGNFKNEIYSIKSIKSNAFLIKWGKRFIFSMENDAYFRIFDLIERDFDDESYDEDDYAILERLTFPKSNFLKIKLFFNIKYKKVKNYTIMRMKWNERTQKFKEITTE